MTIAQNFPTISPSLLLDFANVQALDSRVTFTRATTATYYGTRTALAEQNLVLYSQEFDGVVYWSKINATVTANSTTAPDGTLTADELIPSALDQINIFRTALVPGVFSIYVKDNGISSFEFYVRRGVNDLDPVVVDLDAVTVTTDGTVTTNGFIVNAGNGWYRVGFTAIDSTVTSYGIGKTDVYDGVAGLYIWGAQLEQRSTVTAYTPTTTQAITNYIPVLQTAVAGVPRFDHNPTTFESLGLLVEEQRTNLVTYSSEFDNAAWAKLNATVTANTIVAPDGTISGDTLTTSGAAVAQRVAQSPTATGSLSFSVYAKAGSAQFIQILQTTDGNVFGNFDLANGVVGTKGSSATSTITAVGNGWYRCSVSATLASSNNWGIYITPSASAAYGALYTATVANLFIWGAQLEAGSFATSYIPTVASQVTRAADAASMTGTNFSSWYNQAQGSIYAEVTTPTPASVPAPGFMWYATGGSVENRIELRQINSGDASPRITTLFRTNGVTVVNMTVQTTTIGWTSNNIASAKISLGYQVNDVYLTSDKANAPATDSDATMPSVNNVLFSHTGHYKKIAYYPLRLSNTELQALTS